MKLPTSNFPLHSSPFWWFAVFVWIGVLFYLSSAPRHVPTVPVLHVDKILHFTYFTLGSICVYLALRLSCKNAKPLALALITIAIASLHGALDEYHQSFVPGRSGNDVGDWIADTLGGVAGFFVGSRIFSLVLQRFRV